MDNKKLKLKKFTISQLDNQLMKKAQGGATGTNCNGRADLVTIDFETFDEKEQVHTRMGSCFQYSVWINICI